METKMDRNMVLYRGALKSCNYRCSYCPFSKHPISERERKRDQEQWFRFYKNLIRHAGFRNIRAMMIVPYGEALIHSWYWKGLAELSQSPLLDAVGAQTNLSFAPETALKEFTQAGGNLQKLRLWATFHPEMVSAEEFAEKCKQVKEAGALLCAGAVGVPQHIQLFWKLRKLLPDEIYLWINKLDGGKRPYTKEEKQRFSEIDPFFYRELRLVSSCPALCQNRFFVEGDGRYRACNISSPMDTEWYLQEQEEQNTQIQCRQKFCSCYLAYGGRRDFMNFVLFGPYPLFRIPRRPKAVFLDIDGTLIPEKSSQVPVSVKEDLTALAKSKETYLFFATTLPYREAVLRCRDIFHLFHGGIFAAGAHLLLESIVDPDTGNKAEIKEAFHFFEGDRLLPFLEQQKQSLHFRILVYRHGKDIYKLSLIRSSRAPWQLAQAQKVFQYATENSSVSGLRFFTEGHCMQILAKQSDKANGVEVFCKWLKILPEDVVCAGNSEEDRKMTDKWNGVIEPTVEKQHEKS